MPFSRQPLTSPSPRSYRPHVNLVPMACWLFLSSPAPDPGTQFFLAQARADPEIRIEDAYKWLFHATRGGEHAVVNESAVRAWLEEEWAGLDPPHPDEPLWAPLDAEGRVGRLNLRPYRAQGGSPDALHEAFVAGAGSFEASPARFRAAWKALGQSLKRRPQGPLTRGEWERLDAVARRKGYPARHHSRHYAEVRRPAYRVLPAAQARMLIDSLPAPGPS